MDTACTNMECEVKADLLNAVFEAMKNLSYLDFSKWIKEERIVERIDFVLLGR